MYKQFIAACSLTGALMLSSCSPTTPVAHDVSIIPIPKEIKNANGQFTLKDGMTIGVADKQLLPAANYLSGLLSRSTGYIYNVREGDGDISLAVSDIAGQNEGAYSLDVTSGKVQIKGNTYGGVISGIESLRQLLPAEIESPAVVKDINWSVPAVQITDAPRFGWRGLMLDVSRHFSTKEEVKELLDMMALYKLNKFHWHLTDDQGWRIEIRHYPGLTKEGSRRAETVLGRNTNIYDGIPSGGYYTQRQIRDVVAYAAERFITVIPEIEMPGHASAALAAYPWLGCAGEGYMVRTRWGVFPEVYCAGKDSTFEFMENVLAEVCELFPSEYIHIGGDECPKQSWTSCPACQQRIRNERLEHENELQSYFVHRIEKWLNARGRNLIGWDEILEGGISKTATIMSWRGADGGVAAAKAGNQVIMTPNTHCYLDYFQTQEPERLEPLGIGGYVPVRKVYSFDPYDRLSSAEQSCIQGVQGNIWTEYIASFAHAQHMALPRLAALAEVGWACDRRDFGDFTRRMTVFRKLYDKCGYRYASYFFDGTGE